MLTYKIHLIRHGLTQANFERRYIGVTDLPLCEAGVAQLQQMQEDNEYPGVQRVYTSPLKRAMETAELLFPNRQIKTVDNLRELDFGAFENRTIEDLEQDEAFRAWIAAPDCPAPGGESGRTAAERAVRGLTTVFAEMMEQKLHSVAVVTHAGLMAGMLAQMGLPERDAVRWQCGPGEGYTLLLTPQMWMREQKFEVYGKLPIPLVDFSQEEDLWCDLGQEETGWEERE